MTSNADLIREAREAAERARFRMPYLADLTGQLADALDARGTSRDEPARDGVWRCPAEGPHAAHDWWITSESSRRCAGRPASTDLAAPAEPAHDGLRAAVEALVDEWDADSSGRDPDLPAVAGVITVAVAGVMADLRDILAAHPAEPVRCEHGVPLADLCAYAERMADREHAAPAVETRTVTVTDWTPEEGS